MYRWIVERIVRATWRKVDGGDVGAATRMAAPDIRFRFVGDTALGADLRGAAAFEEWFRRATERLPGLRFAVRDVVVSGWPWATRVAVRLDISAPLPDGTTYRNEGAQFVRLRWGRLVDDWVLEDTQRLAAVLDRLDEPRDVEPAGAAGDRAAG
jgi:ketosteroid isomerase-like protein